MLQSKLIRGFFKIFSKINLKKLQKNFNLFFIKLLQELKLNLLVSYCCFIFPNQIKECFEFFFLKKKILLVHHLYLDTITAKKLWSNKKILRPFKVKRNGV